MATLLSSSALIDARGSGVPRWPWPLLFLVTKPEELQSPMHHINSGWLTSTISTIGRLSFKYGCNVLAIRYSVSFGLQLDH